MKVLLQTESTHSGYVSQAAAACILTAVHKLQEIKAKGEPVWGNVNTFVAHDDGRNMSLQRLRPFHSPTGRSRSKKASRSAACPTSVGEEARHASPTPVLCTASLNPAAPFVPNAVKKTRGGLLSKLVNAAQKDEANKENNMPAVTGAQLLHPQGKNSQPNCQFPVPNPVQSSQLKSSHPSLQFPISNPGHSCHLNSFQLNFHIPNPNLVSSSQPPSQIPTQFTADLAHMHSVRVFPFPQMVERDPQLALLPMFPSFEPPAPHPSDNMETYPWLL